MAIIVFPSRNWLRLWPRSGQAGSRPSLPKCRPGSLDVLVQNRGANDLNVALNVALNVEREASDHFSFYAGVGGSFWNNGNALNLGGGLRWRFGDALKILSRKQAPLHNPPISLQLHQRPADVAVSASVDQSLFAGGELGVSHGQRRLAHLGSVAEIPASGHRRLGQLHGTPGRTHRMRGVDRLANCGFRSARSATSRQTSAATNPRKALQRLTGGMAEW